MIFPGARKKLTHKFIIKFFFFAWKIGKNIQILSILQGQICFCILQVKRFFYKQPTLPIAFQIDVYFDLQKGSKCS